MAEKESGQPSFDPKHRIVGAIILVSLAVIFVPMILDEREPAMKADAVAEIPDRDAAAAPQTKVVVSRLDAPAPQETPVQEPSAPPAANPPPPVPSSKPADQAKPAEPALPPPAAAPAAGQASASARATTSSPPAKAAAPGGWVVQVGTFANLDNAEHLRQRLRQHGHEVRSEPVSLGNTKAVRLRVGPFADREAAVRAQARIKKEIGVQGVVLANR